MTELRLGPEDAACPFCKGRDLSVRPDFSEDEPARIYAYHVFCCDCHARGRNHYRIGWCETPESARQAWNDRPEPEERSADEVKTDRATLKALRRRVLRAVTTVSNDDLSEPRSDKRTRHVERITTLLDVAETIDALAEGQE